MGIFNCTNYQCKISKISEYIKYSEHSKYSEYSKYIEYSAKVLPKPKRYLPIKLVWIDNNINNIENCLYQKIFLEIENIDVKCFDNVGEGIEFLKTIIFERTLIITSGSIYSEFYQKFKENINKLKIVPRIIIFTSDKNKFIKNNNNLPINDTFYNVGGVEDTFSPIKEFVLSKQLLNEQINEKNIVEREKKDKFNFELITDKNQLILPIFLPEYIKIPTSEEIQYFNKYMLKHFKKNQDLNNLFSQLIEVSNIPNEIVSKYWARSYTIESDFYRIMNEDLLKNKIKKYLTFIQMMYEAVKKNIWNLNIIKNYIEELNYQRKNLKKLRSI